MTDPKGPKPRWALGGLLSDATGALKNASDRVSPRLENARSAAKTTIGEGIDRIRHGIGNASKRSSLLYDSDDLLALIRSDNPLIRVQTRHVPAQISQGMMLLAAGAGVFQNTTEIMQFTRAVMDHDQAAVQTLLRRVFSPEQAREISVWMDTAPGAEYAGGWAHRLHHGHDFSALIALTQEYGLVGAAEWTNHVWLRDFWTPHGVPYLPAGSGTVYEWLLDLGLSPSTAIGVLSVNAAEASSGLLVFFSALRVRRAISAMYRSRRYRGRLAKVVALVDEGSTAEALRLIGEIETFSGEDCPATLRLHLAGFCLHTSKHEKAGRSEAWLDKAYMISYDLCRRSDGFPESVEYHGRSEVAFQGLAAQILIASIAGRADTLTPQLEHVADRICFSIRRLLEVSEKQSSPGMLHAGGKPLIGYRPYSALTNLIVALELSLALGGFHLSRPDPAAIRNRMNEVLEYAGLQGRDHAEFCDKVDRSLATVFPTAPVAA